MKSKIANIELILIINSLQNYAEILTTYDNAYNYVVFLLWRKRLSVAFVTI